MGRDEDERKQAPGAGQSALESDLPTEPTGRATTARPAWALELVEAPRLAESLAQAHRGELVHLDEEGQVRSPTRYRVLRALRKASGIGLVTLGGVIYTGLFGSVWGTVAMVCFAAVVATGWAHRRELESAQALIGAGRIDAAEELCKRLLHAALVPTSVRATAHHDLALCAMRRGDFEAALTELRRALRFHGPLSGRDPLAEAAARQEVLLLVNLGLLDEAQAKLRNLATPRGDYLRLLDDMAVLAVHFATGVPVWDDAVLWECSRRALSLHVSAPLLALCAWSWSARGDEVMADHLCAEALGRAVPHDETSFPSLWRWVREHQSAPSRS